MKTTKIFTTLSENHYWRREKCVHKSHFRCKCVPMGTAHLATETAAKAASIGANCILVVFLFQVRWIAIDTQKLEQERRVWVWRTKQIERFNRATIFFHLLRNYLEIYMFAERRPKILTNFEQIGFFSCCCCCWYCFSINKVMQQPTNQTNVEINETVQ